MSKRRFLMSGYFLAYALFLYFLLAAGQLACGQAKQPDVLFPTYQQIKPQDREIIDLVSPPGSTVQARVQSTFTLFDYPVGSVTYWLNKQPTTDTLYVKEVLRNKSVVIESIVIEQPDKQGRRTIRIEYKAL